MDGDSYTKRVGLVLEYLRVKATQVMWFPVPRVGASQTKLGVNKMSLKQTMEVKQWIWKKTSKKKSLIKSKSYQTQQTKRDQ